MTPKIYEVLASVTYRVLAVHGWYRDMLPRRRLRPAVDPEPEAPRPVVIFTTPQVKAEDISRLLGEDHVVVGVVPLARAPE